MRNPSLPTDQAKDFAAAKTLRARIGHQSRQNLADTLRSENRHSEAKLYSATGRTRHGEPHNMLSPLVSMDPPVSRVAATRSVTPGDKAMPCSQSSLSIRKWRKPPSTITSSHIEHFRHIGLSTVRSTIDRTARSQFDIVNAIYLRVRAFARCGLCRRSG